MQPYIQLGDLQVGDRVLVRGTTDADGVSVDATAVIVMKQQDIAQRKQQEMQDWQRRGVGGLVKEVDPQAGTVTICRQRRRRQQNRGAHHDSEDHL